MTLFLELNFFVLSFALLHRTLCYFCLEGCFQGCSPKFKLSVNLNNMKFAASGMLIITLNSPDRSFQLSALHYIKAWW